MRGLFQVYISKLYQSEERFKFSLFPLQNLFVSSIKFFKQKLRKVFKFLLGIYYSYVSKKIALRLFIKKMTIANDFFCYNLLNVNGYKGRKTAFDL